MQECPFCMTQIDDRATVCSECGAKKGYGYHSSYGVLTKSKIERRLKKFRLTKALIICLTVFIITIVYFQDDVDHIASVFIGIVGAIFYVIPALAYKIWAKRVANGDESWFR